MKTVITKNFSSACLETFEDGSGRVTFFNENHWAGEILLTKEQMDLFNA